MILEHSNPHTVYNKYKELLQSGNLRKIHHMLLTLPTGLLFLGQWQSTCKVTNSTARIIQEPNFCHDNCKNLAKMRQAHEGAVGLCKKVMAFKWNNCASFCVPTVIQIMSKTNYQFSINFGMGFDVLTMVRMHNVVWVRTPYSVVHTWSWMFWRSIFGMSTQAVRWWKELVQAKLSVLAI